VYKCSYLEGAVIWLVGLGAPSALCSPGSSSLSEPPDELLSEATRGAFCSGLPSHPPVAEPLLATEKKNTLSGTKQQNVNPLLSFPSLSTLTVLLHHASMFWGLIFAAQIL